MEPGEKEMSLLESLPLTVIDIIAGYLSTKELAACCATNRNMREIFGADIYWKPHCQEGLADYLTETPCKVQPAFTSPVPKDSTLSLVSRYRLSFMVENHLWNNWRLGKFTSEEIENWCVPNSSFHHKFFSNDVVVAIFKDRLEILDVREHPFLEAVEPIPFALSPSFKIHNVGGLMVKVYNTCVLVYDLNSSSRRSSLKHMFAFNKSERLPDTSPSQVLIELATSVRILKYIVVGTYFVGLLKDASSIHIWDLQTGVKVKEEKCPLKNATVCDILDSGTNNLVLVAEKPGKDSKRWFLVYDIASLSFKRFPDYYFLEVPSKDGKYFVSQDCLAIWKNKFLTVINYHTHHVVLEDFPLNSRFCFMKNRFIFIEDQKLKSLNPFNKEVITLRERVLYFEVLSEKFVLVNIDVFEILGLFHGLKKTLTTFDFNCCSLYMNNAGTRCIVWYGIRDLINFW